MKTILRPIFEWITGNYNLFENTIFNYIMMGFIGLIAFGVALQVVGDMYSGGSISSREAGSFFHWLIRLIVFTLLFVVISIIMWIVGLIMSVPLWIWISLIVIVFMVIIVIQIIEIKKKKESIKKENCSD